jgi:predicted Zn-dependent protease
MLKDRFAFLTRALAFALSALLLGAPMAAHAEDQEVSIGKAEAEALQKKGEIIESSPYYEVLRPIARRISAIANPQYQYPFHFILVHEKQANAFAVPGGSIYVTDSLMTFAQNREELAAVLCHETSHDIHHDVVHNLNKTRTLSVAATALSLLIGGGIAGGLIGVAADVQGLHYSRQVEAAADAKGAETCAAAGYNPWGMVWLLEHFAKTGNGAAMEMLSDHPTDGHRIAALKAIFANDPARYGRFLSNITDATPLGVKPLPNSSPIAPPPPKAKLHKVPISKSSPGPVDDDPTF